jgi:RNase H-fold protein (predicted Holliday junction resolvase)
MTQKTVLAIDPGTSKCGVALVHRETPRTAKLIHHRVVPLDALVAEIHNAYVHEPFELVIVGGGTGSNAVVHLIREHFTSVALLIVDEKDTSLQARERYWEYNPRRGWRRLLPSSLQTPPVPVDDFVALILAERVLLEG